MAKAMEQFISDSIAFGYMELVKASIDEFGEHFNAPFISRGWIVLPMNKKITDLTGGTKIFAQIYNTLAEKFHGHCKYAVARVQQRPGEFRVPLSGVARYVELLLKDGR